MFVNKHTLRFASSAGLSALPPRLAGQHGQVSTGRSAREHRGRRRGGGQGRGGEPRVPCGPGPGPARVCVTSSLPRGHWLAGQGSAVFSPPPVPSSLSRLWTLPTLCPPCQLEGAAPAGKGEAQLVQQRPWHPGSLSDAREGGPTCVQCPALESRQQGGGGGRARCCRDHMSSLRLKDSRSPAHGAQPRACARCQPQSRGGKAWAP